METAKQCAQLILANQTTLIAQWEEEVRNEIIASGLSSSIALRNHLPGLINDIAQILIDKTEDGFDHKNDSYLRTIDKTKVHGKIRAETENYTIDQIIKEYTILHRILTELLQSHNILSVNIVNIIKYIFEKTIERSSQVFIETMHETRDKLVGALAHDIRNPLSVALLSSEMLSDDPQGDNQQLVDIIQRSIKRSLHLTEGLLDTLSLKSGEGISMHYAKNDYAQIIHETCLELKQIYTVEIDCKISNSKLPATMDKIAIKRVIENLVSNAIKYGDSTIPIHIILEDDEDFVKLKVNNFGNPIPEERKKTIFKFLQQYSDNNDSSYKGWGIGLSLVKLIVDAHEGSISLNSNETEGTTFIIRLKKELKFSGKTRMRLK